jgi:hypothetical protein
MSPGSAQNKSHDILRNAGELSPNFATKSMTAPLAMAAKAFHPDRTRRDRRGRQRTDFLLLSLMLGFFRR